MCDRNHMRLQAMLHVKRILPHTVLFLLLTLPHIPITRYHSFLFHYFYRSFFVSFSSFRTYARRLACVSINYSIFHLRNRHEYCFLCSRKDNNVQCDIDREICYKLYLQALLTNWCLYTLFFASILKKLCWLKYFSFRRQSNDHIYWLTIQSASHEILCWDRRKECPQRFNTKRKNYNLEWVYIHRGTFFPKKRYPFKSKVC